MTKRALCRSPSLKSIYECPKAELFFIFNAFYFSFFNNEILLEVQGRFIQDHQDTDRVTREGFKLVGIKKTLRRYLKELEKRLK